MKTLIIYASKYGFTEKCARLLAEQLGEGAQVVQAGQQSAADLANFDTVVLGAAVYAGQMPEPLKKFCTENLADLSNKRLGLFICAANEANADEQLRQCFPAELVQAAVTTGHFGYAIQMKKMNFFERAIIRLLMKTKESQERLHHDVIANFAAALIAAA